MLAATLPMTATPRAPPSSRTVSLTAEPTPARAGGSVRHDEVGGGRHGDAGAETEEQEPDAGRDVGRSVDERGLHGDTRAAASSVPVATAMRPPSWPARWAPAPVPSSMPERGGDEGEAGGERACSRG